ncbi:unnamed protein product, partial [marine sediment metagenome]
WIEVKDDLDDNQSIYIYFGKAGASSASNGDNTFIFFDDLNRDDNGLGAKWQAAVGGTATIESNTAKLVATLAEAYVIAVMSTITDFRFIAKIKIDTDEASLLFRADDDEIPSYLAHIYAGTNTGRHYYRTNGGWTLIGSYWSPASATWYRNEFLVSGDSIKWYVGDSLKADITDANVTAAGKVGLRLGNIGRVGYYDDFCVAKYVDPEPVVGTPGSYQIREIVHGYIIGLVDSTSTA